MLIYLLFVSIIFGGRKVASESPSVALATRIDPLIDQSMIDELWIGHMVVAPAVINLLGHMLVVVSAADVSFASDSPGHVYQYIKYPQSFRATLLQVSNGILSMAYDLPPSDQSVPFRGLSRFP